MKNKNFIQALEYGLKGDKKSLLELAESFAVSEINNKRHTSYKKILDLIEKYSGNNIKYQQSGLPHQGTLNNYFLNNNNTWIPGHIKEKIEKYIKYQKSYNIDPELKTYLNKIIFYGPPGSGKTTLGFYLAQQLDRNISYIKVTDMISSKLGETMKNIVNVFEEKNDNIIFIDEFDAIAKNRSDKNDVGELKRIVNSLIQTLDFYSDKKIVIVATNLIDSIDPAILRRFTYKIFMGPLNREDKLNFISEKISKIKSIKNRIGKEDIVFIIKMTDLLGLDTVDELDVLINKVKMHISLDNIRTLDLNIFIEVVFLEDYLSNAKSIKTQDKKFLNEICKKMEKIGYSKSKISRLLDIHRNSYRNYTSN